MDVLLLQTLLFEKTAQLLASEPFEADINPSELKF